MADLIHNSDVKRARLDGTVDAAAAAQSDPETDAASGAPQQQAGPAGGATSSSTGVRPAADALHFGSFEAPLAFVNGCAEALDVLVPNLANHEHLRCGSRDADFVLSSPLACQPAGSGKTRLGLHPTCHSAAAA